MAEYVAQLKLPYILSRNDIIFPGLVRYLVFTLTLQSYWERQESALISLSALAPFLTSVSGRECLISQNFVQQTKLGLFSRYNGQAATFSPLRITLHLLLQKLVFLVSFPCFNLALMSWGELPAWAKSNCANQALLNKLQDRNCASEAVIVTKQDIWFKLHCMRLCAALLTMAGVRLWKSLAVCYQL